ncbi:hypothetical protein PS425_08305 [Limosilactobacillus fermentum]|uniref:hypothetical protein n=1 Tax=Limosilactobacillus fermentum TaxID=1613 RepID=UPI002F268FD3
MYSYPICLIMEFVVIVLKKSVVRSITAALKTQATAYVTAHVQSELKALAAKPRPVTKQRRLSWLTKPS